MLKILVIGELCEDVFIYGSCPRLNPEAPTPIFVPKYETKNKGMAGNVAQNVKSLGIKTDFISNSEKIDKIRYVEETSNYILLRVDSEASIKAFDLKQVPVISFDFYDAVIISDYNKGFLTEEVIRYITELAPLSFIDTKKPFGPWIEKATYIKVNKEEADHPQHNKTTLAKIRHKLIVTLGGDGCMLNGEKYPTKKSDVRDVVGAGDSFLAALAAAYAKTKSINGALMFANFCASQVVQQKGVATLASFRSSFESLV